MHLRVYSLIWLKLDMMVETTKNVNSNTSQNDLDLHSRSQWCGKTKDTSVMQYKFLLLAWQGQSMCVDLKSDHGVDHIL